MVCLRRPKLLETLLGCALLYLSNFQSKKAALAAEISDRRQLLVRILNSPNTQCIVVVVVVVSGYGLVVTIQPDLFEVNFLLEFWENFFVEIMQS